MVNDQAKNAGPVAPEHPYQPALQPYPFSGAGPYPYQFYFQSQPPSAPSASQDGDGVSAQVPPFMMTPHGMLYPFPPTQGFPPFPQPTPPTTSGQRPKRKQVKMACTNCANACKRCDEARPCERCIKYGLLNSCVDGVRKERQKGIKRGPYKRKNKATGSEALTAFPATGSEPDWHANGVSGPTSTSGQPPAPVHPMYPAPPEGYIPYFFPPPGFIPPGHEGASAPEGGSNGSGQPPAMAYYPIPPGYFPYAPPGMYPAPQSGVQVPTMDPSEPSRNAGQPAEAEIRSEGAPPVGKKRNRSGKNEPRSKKSKADSTANKSSTGGTVGGGDRAIEPGRNSPTEGDDA